MNNLLYIKRAKNFQTKHSLGQNFLVDENTIEKILENVNSDDDILEIGAGIGFVTEKLVQKAKSVTAVEIDKKAIELLKKNCTLAMELSKHECDFQIIENDILKTDISKLAGIRKFKVVANIPYYITSPILAHLLGEIDDEDNKNRNSINEIILMVQTEVAKRLVANNNSYNIKDYGLLSLLAQFWADVEIIRQVSKKCFYPSPKVDSALVRLKINSTPKIPVNPMLRRVIKASFSTRRKNIKNCLQNAGFLDVENILKSVEIPLNIRGERLSLEDFVKLSEAFCERNNS